MKKLLFLTFLLLSTNINAQKIIDRSQKKRPDWYGVTRSGFLIVSASSTDLESAKQKSLTELKVQILQSVAQHIEYSTETIVEQLTHNQEVSSNIILKRTGAIHVADLPFISGISLSNATDSYWELSEDKTTGERAYVFSVLYPYSQTDFQALKSQFEKLDSNMEKIVYEGLDSIDKVESIEDIEDKITQLRMAQGYFFDNKRKKWSQNVLLSYKRLFSQLSFVSKKISKGKYQLWLNLNGRNIRCAIIPKLKSDCASNLQCSVENGQYMISFDDSDCIAGEENIISITLRFKESNVRYKLYF